MWLISKAVKAVAKAVTGGNKSSSSSSSNKGSSSSSSNKNSSSSSSSNRSSSASSTQSSVRSNATANRNAATWWNTSSNKSSSSSGWSSSSKSSSAWAGSVAWFSSTPSITGWIWWISSSNKSSSSSGWSSSSKSSSSGGSSTKVTWSVKWPNVVTTNSTAPVASAINGWTILANWTIVGWTSTKSSGGSTSKVSPTITWGVASVAWGWTRLANWAIVGWIWNTGINTGVWVNNTLTNFRSSVGWGSSGSGSTKSTVASNWLMSYNYTQNNANGSPAVSSLAWGKIGYADWSVYDPKTWKTTYPSSNVATKNGLWGISIWWLSSITSWLKTGTTPKYDYTQQNANGSPAVSSWADWTIRYADWTVYDPKTWLTTNIKTWETVNAHGDAGKATDEQIIQAANNKANNAAPSNSSTQNPISKGWSGWTQWTQNTKSNQSAMSIILNSLNADKWGSSLISESLDTGWNRSIASQESMSDNWDGTQTYIAPNWKTYLIWLNEDWQYVTQSNYDGQWFTVWDWSDKDALVDYIRSQNGSDGINRSNVDNKDAYKWAGAQIEWTYVAPSGKEYDILTGTWENAGKTWFININWEAQWFDSQAAALNYIDQRNPVGNKDLAKNTALPTLADRGSYDGEIPETGQESIDEQNEWNQDEWDERDQEIADLRDEIDALRAELERSSDEIDNEKAGIIGDWLSSVDDFTTRMNDAVADLEEKSQMLQDNERMRRARQRAAELAAKWYLTSEQVAQVANYSLTDYNKELEASALEAAKALAELKINLGQKRQDYINAIMNQRTLNASDKQSQINYINDWYTKYIDSIDAKMATADQFYHGLISSNLQMNAQQELWYDSIIRQNDAQNIVNDRNQQKAFTDTEYRRQYILNNITDANLHAYANQAINYLINQGTFIYPWKSNADNKRILAEQISKVTDVARQLQLANQKDLAKVS